MITYKASTTVAAEYIFCDIFHYFEYNLISTPV